ncbi:hypothetical protein BR93DRAFT_697594 [Coniochaeta sp. PMI_546]|nr:hypothetical protein BR93DRAFT_697594 [Coniochaeta sp. PMI_546]
MADGQASSPRLATPLPIVPTDSPVIFQQWHVFDNSTEQWSPLNTDLICAEIPDYTQEHQRVSAFGTGYVERRWSLSCTDTTPISHHVGRPSLDQGSRHYLPSRSHSRCTLLHHCRLPQSRRLVPEPRERRWMGRRSVQEHDALVKVELRILTRVFEQGSARQPIQGQVSQSLRERCPVLRCFRPRLLASGVEIRI